VEDYIIDPLPTLSIKNDLKKLYENIPSYEQMNMDKIKEKRNLKLQNDKDIQQKAVQLKEKYSTKGLDDVKDAKKIEKIVKERDKELEPIRDLFIEQTKALEKKYVELEKKANQMEKEIDKEEKKLNKIDYSVKVVELLIHTFKDRIKQDKTITIDENDNFTIDIDGDTQQMDIEEIIRLMMDKYNELKNTNYNIKSFNKQRQKELIDEVKTLTGSGMTATISRGAGMTATIKQGRGFIEDASSMYKMPRRFL